MMCRLHRFSFCLNAGPPKAFILALKVPDLSESQQNAMGVMVQAQETVSQSESDCYPLVGTGKVTVNLATPPPVTQGRRLFPICCNPLTQSITCQFCQTAGLLPTCCSGLILVSGILGSSPASATAWQGQHQERHSPHLAAAAALCVGRLLAAAA